MNKLAASIAWIEKKGDWLNAILVKETRQALKSRQFVATFLLLLLASWLISLFYVMLEGDAINYGDSGRSLFMFYYFVLLVAITVIVPFGAYRSLLSERDMNTYDVLSITSLSPRQIVWGKLLSALLQVFIYYSAIAPFIAFTSLLEGFELPTVAFMLGVGFFVSLGYCVVSLMVCTFATQKHWQALLSIALLLGMLSSLGMWMAMADELFRFNPFREEEFWWAMALTLGIGLSYCWLCVQVTTAQLTFASDDRSSGIRLTSSVQQLVIWGAFTALIITFSAVLSSNVEFFILGVGCCTLVHWSLIGLIAGTEEDFLSRRIRRSLPRSGFRRLLLLPFLPGGARGYLYLLVNLAVMFAFCAVWLSFSTTSLYAWRAFACIGTLSAYLIFYVGVGSLFGRAARRKWGDFRPSHVRVLTLLFALAGIIIPFIISAMGLLSWSSYSLAHITNPIYTAAAILDGRFEADPAIAIVSTVSALVVLMNFPAMGAAVREILHAPREPLPEEANPLPEPALR